MTHEHKIQYFLHIDKPPLPFTSVPVLSRHILDLLRYFFSRFKNMIPNLIEYRLSMLARNLIAFEVFELISPEDIQVDVYDLMLLRGNGLYTAYFSPCGLNQITEKYIRNYHCAHDRTHKKQYHSSQILPVLTKLTRAVGGAWCNYLR